LARINRDYALMANRALIWNYFITNANAGSGYVLRVDLVHVYDSAAFALYTATTKYCLIMLFGKFIR
jgi:hypothetical protein